MVCQYTLYSLQYSLSVYTVQCTLYSVHCTVCTLRCTFHPKNFLLDRLNFTQILPDIPNKVGRIFPSACCTVVNCPPFHLTRLLNTLDWQIVFFGGESDLVFLSRLISLADNRSSTKSEEFNGSCLSSVMSCGWVISTPKNWYFYLENEFKPCLPILSPPLIKSNLFAPPPLNIKHNLWTPE